MREDLVWVDILRGNSRSYLVRVEFVPTVPHCSLATLIGLCLRYVSSMLHWRVKEPVCVLATRIFSGHFERNQAETTQNKTHKLMILPTKTIYCR